MQGFTNTADRNETISYIEECGCQTEAAEADCVKTAMAFARQCHQGQTRLGRDGKVPYYDEHILGVYHILKDECHVEDETVLVVALLHDTVEDTDCTFEDIEKIANICDYEIIFKNKYNNTELTSKNIDRKGVE